MISDAIKRKFVDAVLLKTGGEIHDAQAKVVEDWNLIKTGELYKALKGHFDISLDSTDTYQKMTMGYFTYSRILDMKGISKKRREGYHIYNKIVFGKIYGVIVPKLQFGLTKDVQREITEAIKDSYRQGPYTVKD